MSWDFYDMLKGGGLAALATLIAALIGWLKDRNQDVRRLQRLDQATKYVEFWKLTYELRISLVNDQEGKADLKRELEMRLAYATSMIDEIAPLNAKPEPVVSGEPTSKVANWLFLHKVQYTGGIGIAAAVMRLYYWYFLLLLLVSCVLYPINGSQADLGIAAGIMFGFLIAIVIIRMFVEYLQRRMNPLKKPRFAWGFRRWTRVDSVQPGVVDVA